MKIPKCAWCNDEIEAGYAVVWLATEEFFCDNDCLVDLLKHNNDVYEVWVHEDGSIDD